MNTCEVIVNFDVKDFEILKKKFDLNNTVFYTDDLLIRNTIRNIGYQIYELREDLGYVNPKIYGIYENAIKKLKEIKNELAEIRYHDVLLVDGLKSYFLDRLTFLEKIRIILKDEKGSIFKKGKNVIFLFNNLSYFHFSIPAIASLLHYKSNFGVSKIYESDLMKLDFKNLFQSVYKNLYERKKGESDTNEFDNFNSELEKKLQGFKPEIKHAFFLINNKEDFYLKPVYPILDKFEREKTSYLVFTFYPTVTNQLLEKNIAVFELPVNSAQLHNEMVEENLETVSRFFNILSNFQTNDHVLKSFLPFFYNDIIVRELGRVLVLITAIEKIFKKFNFKSVVVGADGVEENDLVCSIAKSHNVPTFSIPPSMTEMNPVYGILYNARKLLLSGTRLEKELMKLGIDKDRLIVTGNPRYDYVKLNSPSQENNHESLNRLAKKKKLVIVAMSRIHENDEKWMSQLIQFCNQHSLDILIKLHPMYQFSDAWYNITQQKIESIAKLCTGLKYEISYNKDLTILLPHAALLVTESSLVGIEASLHEVSLIVANFHKEKFYDYSLQFHKEKIALYAITIKELFDCIDRILNDKEVNSYLQERRSKFNYEFNYLNDGKAADRIFAILKNSTKY